jgi:hypothetical protein
VVPFVLASSIWLQEGPPLTDLIAIVKARRNAAIFADVLGFLTGGGRTTARERTCASSTPNSEAWSTRPATTAPRNEERIDCGGGRGHVTPKMRARAAVRFGALLSSERRRESSMRTAKVATGLDWRLGPPWQRIPAVPQGGRSYVQSLVMKGAKL